MFLPNARSIGLKVYCAFCVTDEMQALEEWSKDDIGLFQLILRVRVQWRV